ncbi:MAG: lipid A 3-O-deacylase [Desulforhopalus sp.]|jgi:lipid A 3-O-deacylase
MASFHKHISTKKYRTIERDGLVCFFLFALFIGVSVTAVHSVDAGGLDTTKDNWALIGGYGQSFPGWGETTQRVETIDFIPRYNHRIFDNIGSGWYRGFHSIFLELPVSIVVSPDDSSMVGANFLAAYTFTADLQWQPYLFGGGGPVYSFADVPGMGAELNGNYQFGIGMKYPWDQIHQLLFEVRYHHISNAGSEAPNDPLNSAKFLIGLTF